MLRDTVVVINATELERRLKEIHQQMMLGSAYAVEFFHRPSPMREEMLKKAVTTTRGAYEAVDRLIQDIQGGA